MPRRFIAAHDARRRGGGVPRAIVYVEIDEYIDGLAKRGDGALRGGERKREEEGWPICGPAEGSLPHTPARAIRARRILQLGTAIGYSGTWLARALPDDGELVTVEHNPETAAIARKNMEKTGVATKVKILVGDAQGILKDLKGPFDYIFNDIDKAGYPAVLDPAIVRLRVGGVLVTDNVPWGGDVARKDRSSETQAIRNYNERLAKDSRMIASIVPLRDGVSVALKVRE